MISHLLARIGNFNQQEEALILQYLNKKPVLKNEFLLKEKEICHGIYFIQKGAFIQYNFKNEVDQNIIDLHLAGEWVLNSQSFIRQQPSQTFIEAFEDSIVYELSIHHIHELIHHSPVFFQLGKLMEPVHSRVQLFDNPLSPTEKYQFILDNRPELLQSFPLKIIASYLKMAPETLSRVREKLYKENKIS